MKKWSVRILLLLSALLFLAGCANRSSATLTPGTDLSKAKNFYVVKSPPDDRGIHKLIVDQLTKIGYTAKSGPELSSSYNADVVVTYLDKWMWDITMYMIELTITFRTPDTGFPMAIGNSFHTSLTRLSPQEMVDEVLTSIFNKAKQGP
jgi:hypothetical protein